MQETAESERIEFKTCTGGRLPSETWESITAFSNGDGGSIYLGVDQTGTPVGLTAEELDRLQRDIQSDCSSSYNVTILPQVSVVDGTVRAYIPPAASKPVYSVSRGVPRGGRIRVGSVNAQLTDEHIRQFVFASRGGVELTAQNMGHHDLDALKIDRYIDTASRKRKIDLVK